MALSLLVAASAGLQFLENRDDLRFGEAALTHVSLLAGLYARELTVSACPKLPPQVNGCQATGRLCTGHTGWGTSVIPPEKCLEYQDPD